MSEAFYRFIVVACLVVITIGVAAIATQLERIADALEKTVRPFEERTRDC